MREYLAIAEDAHAKKDFDYDLGRESVRYLKDDEEHPTVEVPEIARHRNHPLASLWLAPLQKHHP